jgi:hypothetical protein
MKHVAETQRLAVAAGLSFAQVQALQWLSWHLDARRNDWRAAGIRSQTLFALKKRGLIFWSERTGRPGGTWSLAPEGLAAIASTQTKGETP